MLSKGVLELEEINTPGQEKNPLMSYALVLCGRSCRHRVLLYRTTVNNFITLSMANDKISSVSHRPHVYSPVHITSHRR
jgi:hypothetical protein